MKTYEPFKYATEAGINMHLEQFYLCQQEDFQYMEEDEMLPFYNIYFICQRPRVEVQPNSMRVEKDRLSFIFNVHEKNEKYPVSGGFKNPLGEKKVTMKSDYPHNYFTITDEEGNNGLVKASHVLDESKEHIMPRPSFLDLEILYVGQTNRTSKKPILDRLISHKTLQKIYSQVTPDKEIYLMLCTFTPTGFIESRGTVRVQKEYEQEDIKRFKGFMENQLAISVEQQINLAEASLIKYFQPKYNIVYKETFPDQKHSNYDECYTLDLSAVSLEVITDFYFFSENITSSNVHSFQFQLNTDEERRTLFDLSVGFDT